MSFFFEEEENKDFFTVRKEYELSTVYEADKPVYTYLSKVVENGEDSFLKRITRYDINGEIMKEESFDDDTELDFSKVIEDYVLNDLGQIETRIIYADGKSTVHKYEYNEVGILTSKIKMKRDNKTELFRYTYNKRGERTRTEQIKNDGSSWIYDTKILSEYPRETTTYTETNGELTNLSYLRLNDKGVPVKNISVNWRNGVAYTVIITKDDNGFVEISDTYEGNRFVERKIIWRKLFSRHISHMKTYKQINNKLHLDREQVFIYEYF